MSQPKTSDPVVVVSSDTHIGPRLVEDLRDYCPNRNRPAFDEFVAQHRAHYEAQSAAHVAMYEEVDGRRQRVSRNRLTNGHHDMQDRLRDMDWDGVSAEVLFHGSQNDEPIPFTALGDPNSAVIFKNSAPDDPDLAALGRHMYNQWLADACSTEPARHVGLAQLPVWDIDASVAELEWAADVGLRGVNFPVMQSWLPGYSSHEWEPLWSAAEALQMPLVTHIGAGTDSDYSGVAGRAIAAIEFTAMFGLRAVPSMVFSGVFERHPGLRFVITEVPGMWWHQFMDQLDSAHRFNIHTPAGANPGLAELCPRPPSDYCAENLFVGASFMCRAEAEAAVEFGYDANYLWGSDYPHSEGTFEYPVSWSDTPQTHLAQRFALASIKEESSVRDMLGMNAVRVFGLDLAALTEVAARINSPRIEELSEPVEGLPPGSHSLAFRTHGWWD